MTGAQYDTRGVDGRVGSVLLSPAAQETLARCLDACAKRGYSVTMTAYGESGVVLANFGAEMIGPPFLLKMTPDGVLMGDYISADAGELPSDQLGSFFDGALAAQKRVRGKA